MTHEIGRQNFPSTTDVEDLDFSKKIRGDVFRFISVSGTSQPASQPASQHQDARNYPDAMSDVLAEVFRLRYRVYCQEYGFESPYADHEAGTIIDGMDASALHFLAMHNGKVVACLRMNAARDGVNEHLESKLNMRSSSLHPEMTAIWTKLMIEKEVRGKGIDRELLSCAATICVAMRIYHNFMDCRLSLAPYYKRVGWRTCGDIFEHYETGTVVPMMFDLLDVEYLRSIKSPVIRNDSVKDMLENMLSEPHKLKITPHELSRLVGKKFQ